MEHLTGPPSNEKILYTEWYRAKVISYVPKQKKKKNRRYLPTYTRVVGPQEYLIHGEWTAP